ncbi:AN1-type zinc finger protein 4 [Eumeta japonica]|uniref:AN1-type zinc finger protein 4 n=1 Tax=Eumeta variegata TaxID=151549 RepID=A0A4C1TVZ1_EUMVA|nr:AN1-type zinc finger protein 4 [Eumeta japonica]
MSQHGCPERLSSRSKGFPEEGTSQPTMEVLVETLTGTAFEMTVSPSDTIFAIKSKIFRVEVCQQHLLYNLRELEDGRSLREQRVVDGARLRLVLALRGGPVATRRLPPPPPIRRDLDRLLDANSFLVASDACAAAGSGCLARSKAGEFDHPTAENEEIIASWLNESDESSADENDYIQSDRVVDSEDEYCDDEEATACDLDSASSEDDIPLSYIAGRTDRHVSVCSESDTIDESDRTQRRRKYYYGKKRCMKWSAEGPSRTTRTPAHNIYQIIENTNQRLELMRDKYKHHCKPELKDIDSIELDAFIGLLIFSAAFKSNDEDLNALFATDGTGRDIFRGVMSKERFAMILISLRFDDASTRAQEKSQMSLHLSHICFMNLSPIVKSIVK